MEPFEMKGTCILGLIFNPESGSPAGDYARTKPQKDNTGTVSSNIYYQQTDGIQSKNLENIAQASGGILPAVNKNIGASMCTFIKGYFAPDGVSPHFPLIKGPSKITDFGSPIGSWGYNPLPLVDAAVVPSMTAAEEGYNPNDFNTDYVTLSQDGYTTIPSRPSRRYPQSLSAKPLTTWNIWEPTNLTGFGNAGVAPNQTVRYQPNWGILYPSSLTADQQKQFCFATPSFDRDMDGAYIVCPSPNTVTSMRRMFPIACDLAYRYEDLNHKPQIHYPPVGGGVNAPSPRDIMSTGGENCGFQLHFQFNAQPKSSVNANTNTSDGIYIYWGDPAKVSDASEQVIDQFYLQLTPGESPYLYFLNPYTQLWDNYPLMNAPVFGSGGEKFFSVYVHFAGPLMLVGFNGKSSTISWHSFNPIALTPLGASRPDKFYPKISAQAQCILTFANILTTFRYGAIAFNNYDIDGWWNLKKQDLSAAEKYNCRLITNFLLPNRTSGQVTESSINSQFHQERIRNPIADNLSVSTTASNKPSYYADWRKIINTEANTGYELNWQKISASNTSKSGNEVLLKGRVVWDTTIEGPLYIHVASPSTAPETTTDLLRPVIDLSEYLTGWNVSYSYPGNDQLHTFLTSKATVTLKDLATTPQGRTILTLLEGNIFGVTLGAGIDDVSNYFQGVVLDVSTDYEKSGSTTTLECEDLMTHILDNTLFPNHFAIDGYNYLKAISLLIDCGGMKPWYEQDATEEFVNFYADKNLGAPFAEPMSNSSVYEFTFQDDISKTLTPVLAHFVDPRYPAVLYWNPNDKKIKLDWRKRSDNRDVLTFYGYTDANMLTFLPTDLHGVITDKYTIKANTSNIHAGLFLVTTLWDTPMVLTSIPLDESSFSLNTLNELQDQVDISQASENDIGYVGWKKIKYLNLNEHMQVRTRPDLERFSKVYKDNFMKNAYTTINFSVYVTQPLHPQGEFAIKTFLGVDADGANIVTQETDWYRYNQLQYTYTKNENKIVAHVSGEKFPPVLLLPGKDVGA